VETARPRGFGGGVGLRTLLDCVGPEDLVHRVDFSDTMLAMARGRYRQEIARGRLTLHAGDMVAPWCATSEMPDSPHLGTSESAPATEPSTCSWPSGR
jgi:hypothetical protein